MHPLTLLLLLSPECQVALDVGLLAHRDWYVREAATTRLVQRQGPVDQQLKQLPCSPDPEVKKRLERVRQQRGDKTGK